MRRDEAGGKLSTAEQLRDLAALQMPGSESEEDDEESSEEESEPA